MAYDPADHTVAEVEEWVSANRNQASRVRALEEDGKARSTLLDWFDANFSVASVTPFAATPGVEQITLSPTSAHIGDPDILLTVTGSDATFNANSNIIFHGANTETTLVDASHVTTVVKPDSVVTADTVDVWVWTDGVNDTAPAQFTFHPTVTQGSDVNATTTNENLTLQLKAWGRSSEPVRWAFDQYQAPITAIRAVRDGWGTVATAQGVLDSSFPFNQLDAAEICEGF